MIPLPTKTALTRSLKAARKKTPTEAQKIVKSVLGSRWNAVQYVDGDREKVEAAIPIEGYQSKGDPDSTRYEFPDGSAILASPLWHWDFGIHRTWLDDSDFVSEWGNDDALPASYHDSHERFAFPK